MARFDFFIVSHGAMPFRIVAKRSENIFDRASLPGPWVRPRVACIKERTQWRIAHGFARAHAPFPAIGRIAGIRSSTLGGTDSTGLPGPLGSYRRASWM